MFDIVTHYLRFDGVLSDAIPQGKCWRFWNSSLSLFHRLDSLLRFEIVIIDFYSYGLVNVRKLCNACLMCGITPRVMWTRKSSCRS